ncbi:unnamed protein product [Protopolystoma xenopodis]|uniref:Uncharacterized protein n=1 Tax=Protopolystoma xenopodis TaxID=117903 RepID=A0A448WA92_9PLAT|nr:unnamed protein product [Protopolystoma xenopodis]
MQKYLLETPLRGLIPILTCVQQFSLPVSASPPLPHLHPAKSHFSPALCWRIDTHSVASEHASSPPLHTRIYIYVHGHIQVSKRRQNRETDHTLPTGCLRLRLYLCRSHQSSRLTLNRLDPLIISPPCTRDHAFTTRVYRPSGAPVPRRLGSHLLPALDSLLPLEPCPGLSVSLRLPCLACTLIQASIHSILLYPILTLAVLPRLATISCEEGDQGENNEMSPLID